MYIYVYMFICMYFNLVALRSRLKPQKEENEEVEEKKELKKTPA